MVASLEDEMGMTWKDNFLDLYSMDTCVALVERQLGGLKGR